MSILLFFVLGLTAATSQAQLKDVLSKAGSKPNPASLLTQFAGVLKPTSFLSSWASKRPAFMNALSLLK